MIHIDKNYGPIIMGNYISHQEIHIDKQLNIDTHDKAETHGKAETHDETEAHGKAEAHDEAEAPGEAESPVADMGQQVERIFCLAEKRKLLSQVGNGYIWHKSETLLDYFLGRALCGDYPSRDDNPCWCFAKKKNKMPAKKMNLLFGREGIGNIRRKRCMLSVPHGHEWVDNIMDDAVIS